MEKVWNQCLKSVCSTQMDDKKCRLEFCKHLTHLGKFIANETL